MDHYIGIDVGTGSARACIIDSTGDIKACRPPSKAPIALHNRQLTFGNSGYGEHWIMAARDRIL